MRWPGRMPNPWRAATRMAEAHGAFTTPLTERLGCRYPIVQTAMGWIATPPLVAAACNAGAFGFLAGAVMRPEALRAAVRAVKAATDQPFGVNFHMFQAGA